MADHIKGWGMWDDTASLQRIIIGMQDVAPDPRQDTTRIRQEALAKILRGSHKYPNISKDDVLIVFRQLYFQSDNNPANENYNHLAAALMLECTHVDHDQKVMWIKELVDAEKAVKMEEARQKGTMETAGEPRGTLIAFGGSFPLQILPSRQ